MERNDTTGLMEGLTRIEAREMAFFMKYAGLMYRRSIGKPLADVEIPDVAVDWLKDLVSTKGVSNE